jgi:hypothetical protein
MNRISCIVSALTFTALTSLGAIGQEKRDSIEMMPGNLSAWKTPIGDWTEVGDVALDPKNPRKLVAKPGKGIWYNGPKGRTSNLYSKQKFADVEVHLEFCIPKGSNSGIKFHGHYEIQIYDSFGRKEVSGEDCGGIYPRAEIKGGKYLHIDKGVPPKVNACKAPGEWQVLDATFLAPRFDKEGKKIKNAMILKAVLNGQVIHDKQELLTPTGDRWPNKEMREGLLMLQADHGPVAFRNMRVKVLD